MYSTYLLTNASRRLSLQFNRRIASIEEFKFVSGAETHEMGVAICIPGILAEREDLHRVWGSDFGKFYFDEEVKLS